MSQGIVSDYFRKARIKYFLQGLRNDSVILEIGSGSGWVGKYLKSKGCLNYLALDIIPPADIVGSIKDYKKLGLKDNTFDVIIAFEIVEHIDCFQECYNLLKQGGKMCITTPVPHMDWLLRIMERLRITQKRTSAHSNLTYLETIPNFEKEIKKVALFSQWAIFYKR